MNQIKDAFSSLIFPNESFEHPIPYAFLYVQWDANNVSHTVLTN